MDILLNDDEVRVLGCLMEKEMATPDYYPLTLNALINACNQKSNRNPVVSYTEDTVISALDGLREKKLVRQSSVSRALKYEQICTNAFNMITREEAVICILLLRGPQTVGEIRGRTERLFAFPSLDEVKETIASLEDMGLIRMLPRQPGRKESRYTHLLAGEPEEIDIDCAARPETTTIIRSANNDRIRELEEQVDELRQQFQTLQQEFETFKTQFE